jgi:hypothetical protein
LPPGGSPWPSIKNFYIELSVDPGTCSGKDSYGLIIRGPEHEAGVSYGYVVAFACDGSYQVYRLDRVDPYMAVDLVNWTKSNSILAGSNQKNKLGIKAEGDKLTIYANGYQLIQVTDSKYTTGRYGVYIRPDVTWYYTYRPIQIAWEPK